LDIKYLRIIELGSQLTQR